MPIRWSALKVKQAMDRTEELVNQILPTLEQAKQVVAEAKNIPNLPSYMTDRLSSLLSELTDITGGISRWTNQPVKGRLHNKIEYVLKDLPKDELAKEQAEFNKLLTFFNGDREKAEMTMNLGKTKAEKPKEQMVLVAVEAQPLIGYDPVSEAISETGGDPEPEHEADPEPDEVEPNTEPEPETDGKEICFGCGRSVAQGSGSFVNRVPSFDTTEDRKEMGVPYPEGGWMCGECDDILDGGDDPRGYYLSLTPEERKERGIPDDFEQRCQGDEE